MTDGLGSSRKEPVSVLGQLEVEWGRGGPLLWLVNYSVIRQGHLALCRGAPLGGQCSCKMREALLVWAMHPL